MIITAIVAMIVMSYELPAPAHPEHTRSNTPYCLNSYPDFCIPPGTPDLDCPDIPFSDFVVRGSDPHRFDLDNDGVGCESR